MQQKHLPIQRQPNWWDYLLLCPLQSSLPPKKPLFPWATELPVAHRFWSAGLTLMPWGEQLPAALHKYWKQNSLGKRPDQHEQRANYRLLQKAHLQPIPDKASQRECYMPCGFNNFCHLGMGVFLSDVSCFYISLTHHRMSLMSSLPFTFQGEQNFWQICLFLDQGELKEFSSCFETRSFGHVHRIKHFWLRTEVGVMILT